MPDILAEITGIDYGAAAGRISAFLESSLREGGAKGVVFGLSGGVDSATVAYLCARALKDHTTALIMPDTSVSPRTETENAIKIVSLTGIRHKLIDIRPIVSEFGMYIEPNARAAGNLRARVRASLLYYYANLDSCLVLGTSDRTEHGIGYFTKYGDGACDISPISSLYKLQVRGLAKHLGVPEDIISQKSSPHLWPDHTAEGELGMTYEELDAILYCMQEKKMGAEAAAAAAGVGVEAAKKVQGMRDSSAHKRAQPRQAEL